MKKSSMMPLRVSDGHTTKKKKNKKGVGGRHELHSVCGEVLVVCYHHRLK